MRRCVTVFGAVTLLVVGIACSPGPDPLPPTDPLADIVSLAAGWNHSCAALADGAVKCWGQNTSGQLGDGTAVPRYAPVFIDGFDDVVAVSVGEESCALHAVGTVSCWGNGVYTPRPMAGLTDVVEIEVGFDRSTVAEPYSEAHNCVLHADGTVECWGDNTAGQLGDGTTTSRLSPVPVLGLDDAVAIGVGERHTCAVHADGSVSCWGSPAFGKLAPGVTTLQTTPMTVPGVAGAVDVDGGGDHTCARLADGTVRCWGASGLLGGAGTGIVTVDSLDDAVDLDVGISHSCAVTASGSVECWGANGNFVLGGAPSYAGFPVVVGTLTNIAQVTAGRNHTCVRLASTTARCWGDNSFGKIGDATTTPRTTPTVVLQYFPGSES